MENIQNEIARLEAELQEEGTMIDSLKMGSDESEMEQSGRSHVRKSNKRMRARRRRIVIDSDDDLDDVCEVINSKEKTAIRTSNIADISSDDDVPLATEGQLVMSPSVNKSRQVTGQNDMSQAPTCRSSTRSVEYELETGSPRSPSPPPLPEVTSFITSTQLSDLPPRLKKAKISSRKHLAQIKDDEADGKELETSIICQSETVIVDDPDNANDGGGSDDDKVDDDDDDICRSSYTSNKKRKRHRDVTTPLSEKKRKIKDSENDENLVHYNVLNSKQMASSIPVVQDPPRDHATREHAQIRTPLRIQGSPTVITAPANPSPGGSIVTKEVPQLRTPSRSYQVQQSIIAKLSANRMSPYDVSKQAEFPAQPDWCFAASGINKTYHLVSRNVQ